MGTAANTIVANIKTYLFILQKETHHLRIGINVFLHGF